MNIDPVNLEWRQAYELLTSIVVPRPIAFVSTIGEDGVFNVAPFSFFSGICVAPMLVGFSVGRKRDGQKKDTVVNIEFSKDFVINVVTEPLAEAMNRAAGDYPSDIDEFEETGLTPVKADMVKPPMVGESPITMECRLEQILEFGNAPRLNSFIIGSVVRVHINNDLYAADKQRASQLKAIGRLWLSSYCRTTDTFEMKRPD
jgi:flavin reductase (DIM6/NTAB) family NADH-FMN oxidoreductase RutF